MATKKYTDLAFSLEKLEKDRDLAIANRETKSTITIKTVAGEDIIIDRNHISFYDGLIATLNKSIDETKKEMTDLMFPTKATEG